MTDSRTLLGAAAFDGNKPDRQLSVRLCGPIQQVKLYGLDGAGAVEQLAADMKAYRQQHTAPVTTE